MARAREDDGKMAFDLALIIEELAALKHWENIRQWDTMITPIVDPNAKSTTYAFFLIQVFFLHDMRLYLLQEMKFHIGYSEESHRRMLPAMFKLWRRPWFRGFRRPKSLPCPGVSLLYAVHSTWMQRHRGGSHTFLQPHKESIQNRRPEPRVIRHNGRPIE